MNASYPNEPNSAPAPNLLTAPPLPLSPTGSSPISKPPAPFEPLPSEIATQPPVRLLSLDAYRGLIMIALAFGGFGLAKAATKIINLANDRGDTEIASLWQTIQYQFSHAEWVGCSFWDLVQPSFMFMVGVSVAYSYASREAKGHSYMRMAGHALVRAVILILLGAFLVSHRPGFQQWSFTNVLSQIGLGYFFLFLMWGRGYAIQWGVAFVVLAGTTAAMYMYADAGIKPGAEPKGADAAWVQQHLVDVPTLYPHGNDRTRDIEPEWHKNANFFTSYDQTLLNRLPHQGESITLNRGGYATLNFVPAFVTMLFGLMTGQLLRGSRSDFSKFGALIFYGVVALALGYILDYTGYLPLIKRIWTPSFAIFCTGWCLLFLALLYFIFDLCRLRFLAWPLKVAGMNSMVLYILHMTSPGWAQQLITKAFGQDFYANSLIYINSKISFIETATLETYAQAAAPIAQLTSVGILFWLIVLVLYAQKIFIRI
jgi:predicted acyltransferase